MVQPSVGGGLQARGLTKRYGGLLALDRVDFLEFEDQLPNELNVLRLNAD